MQQWVRFERAGSAGFGVCEGNQVRVHTGNMFTGTTPTGEVLALDTVKLLAPTQPRKIVALWNNFKALGEKLNLQHPPELLYFLKSPNSWLNPGEVIRKPAQEGKIVFEGELGVVIGKTTATNLFPEGNAVGQRIRLNSVPVEIIGILESR